MMNSPISAIVGVYSLVSDAAIFKRYHRYVSRAYQYFDRTLTPVFYAGC